MASAVRVEGAASCPCRVQRIGSLVLTHKLCQALAGQCPARYCLFAGRRCKSSPKGPAFKAGGLPARNRGAGRAFSTFDPAGNTLTADKQGRTPGRSASLLSRCSDGRICSVVGTGWESRRKAQAARAHHCGNTGASLRQGGCITAAFLFAVPEWGSVPGAPG